jgi:hypothetical protein
MAILIDEPTVVPAASVAVCVPAFSAETVRRDPA